MGAYKTVKLSAIILLCALFLFVTACGSAPKKNTLSREETLDVSEITKMIGADSLIDEGFTGKNITIAVIDTGVYPHDDLVSPRNRILRFKDFVNAVDEPYDDSGHGTAISGIIAGNRGVAPDANLIVLKVLNDQNFATPAKIVEAIDWVIDHKTTYDIKILNLSCGVQVSDTTERDALSDAVDAAFDSGILVITSAGNRYITDTTRYSPAVSGKVLTVGSIKDMRERHDLQYHIADFSSGWTTGKGVTKPDMVTFGVNIVVPESDINYKPSADRGLRRTRSWTKSSGTSESAAIITGVAAVIWQKSPDLTAREIYKTMIDHCIRIESYNSHQGYGFFTLE